MVGHGIEFLKKNGARSPAELITQDEYLRKSCDARLCPISTDNCVIWITISIATIHSPSTSSKAQCQFEQRLGACIFQAQSQRDDIDSFCRGGIVLAEVREGKKGKPNEESMVTHDRPSFLHSGTTHLYLEDKKMENPIYSCGNCHKIIYLMEPGHGKELKCCDQKMKEMSTEDKEKYLKDKAPFHPKFTEPGAP